MISRCLEFRPEDRFKEVRDVISALNPGRRSKNIRIAGVGAALTVIAVSVALVRMGLDGRRVEEVSQLTPDTDLTSRPSLSRDGQVVAYSSDRAEAGNLDIWVQHLPSGTPIRLTTSPAEDLDPNIAPDGSSVVFRSERNGGGYTSLKCRAKVSACLRPMAGIHGFHLTVAVLSTGSVIGTKRLHRDNYSCCPLQMVRRCASPRTSKTPGGRCGVPTADMSSSPAAAQEISRCLRAPNGG